MSAAAPTSPSVDRRRQNTLRKTFESYRAADSRDALVMRIHTGESHYRKLRPALRVRLNVSRRLP